MLQDSHFANITQERKKALAQTLQEISLAELKQIGEKLFPDFSHPWRDAFFDFVSKNEDAAFHQASTADGIHIVYCKDKDKGIWFLGNGVGPLQDRGRAVMKSLIAERNSNN